MDEHSFEAIVNNYGVTGCPDQYFFLQQEQGIGTDIWAEYTGPHVILDSLAQTLTIEAFIDEYSLNGQTYHMRIGVASVADLSLAITPTFWDVTVTFVHPCQSAIFSGNGGVTTPIVAVVRQAIHPYPITEVVADFPYLSNG